MWSIFPHLLAIGSLLAVPGGLIYAGTCWSESCAKCSTALEDKRIGFDTDRATAEAAVKSGSAMRILELQPQTSAGHAVTAQMRYCPKCKRLALLTGPASAKASLFDDAAVRLIGQVV